MQEPLPWWPRRAIGTKKTVYLDRNAGFRVRSLDSLQQQQQLQLQQLLQQQLPRILETIIKSPVRLCRCSHPFP
jgi:hypothetical protein